VPEKYKAERPGSAADLNAYTALYYGGNANVGAKTIAINLPNDEVVQLKKGTRRLQLEERHPRQVRPHPAADRQGTDRRGPTEKPDFRRLLRRHHVP
jgi:hypothetical protein